MYRLLLPNPNVMRGTLPCWNAYNCNDTVYHISMSFTLLCYFSLGFHNEKNMLNKKNVKPFTYHGAASFGEVTSYTYTFFVEVENPSSPLSDVKAEQHLPRTTNCTLISFTATDGHLQIVLLVAISFKSSPSCRRRATGTANSFSYSAKRF